MLNVNNHSTFKTYSVIEDDFVFEDLKAEPSTMFELWKELQWLKNLCLSFVRLLWPLESISMREFLLGSAIIVIVVAFLFSRYSVFSLDFTLRLERLLCSTVTSFVSAMVCKSVCYRICFTFCEMMDDCPISTIVHECGYYLYCVIHASIAARILFVKGSNGGLEFLLAKWKCIKPYTFSKHKEHSHLLCFCKDRV